MPALPSGSAALRRLLAFCALSSAAILSVALTAQYAYGQHPCELCLAQRYPYAAIMALAGIAAWRLRSPESLRLALLLCALLFLLDAGIAGYHAGVEAGIFTGPSACSAGSGGEQTLEEMRRAILEAELVPCDQPMTHYFGLSMAAWNAMAAFALFAFTAWRWKKSRG